MLHRDGLIYMHNHRGAMVSSSSPELAYQYAEVRGVLEAAAAELAAPFHTKESVAELRALNARLKQAAQAGQPVKFREINREFHIVICSPCPNEVLKTTLDGIWDQIRRMSVKSLVGEDRARMVSAVREHDAIVKAIANCDAAKVATTMRFHAQETVTAWRRVIEAMKKI
jgi:DNA-binding GntR family transcriptional regulator